MATVGTGRLRCPKRTAIRPPFPAIMDYSDYLDADRTKECAGMIQRAVDTIMSRAKWQFDLVYLEYIIFYSKSVTELPVHVCTLVELLQEARVPLEVSK